MKITIEATIDGEKKVIEREGDFAFLISGNDVKDSVKIEQFIHFEKVKTEDFDSSHALLSEFFAIKSLLAHFEKTFKANLALQHI